MLTVLSLCLFAVVFLKVLGFAIRLGWGLFKIVGYVILFPAIILFLIFSGLFFVALPIMAFAWMVGRLVAA